MKRIDTPADHKLVGIVTVLCMDQGIDPDVLDHGICNQEVNEPECGSRIHTRKVGKGIVGGRIRTITRNHIKRGIGAGFEVADVDVEAHALAVVHHLTHAVEHGSTAGVRDTLHDKVGTGRIGRMPCLADALDTGNGHRIARIDGHRIVGDVVEAIPHARMRQKVVG
ncbi:MAG: hypothetical protein BWY82_02506 [Verrucomicrobia bacterium ADurb.Bin474]|nr:MAG: hypothetical protein BWY82_02506 [Verrucomicrobia bacterium ADurb.Bin474]